MMIATAEEQNPPHGGGELTHAVGDRECGNHQFVPLSDPVHQPQQDHPIV